MDTKTKALVEAAEARASDLPNHTADTWSDFVADVVVGETVIGGCPASVVESIGVKPHEARALASVRRDVSDLCAAVRAQDAEREKERMAWREYATALHNEAMTYETCGNEDMAEATDRLARATSALVACGVSEDFINAASTSS